VKGSSSVVADDSAAAVGVRQTGDEAQVSSLLHFLGVGLEHAVVMGGDVVEHLVYFFRKLFAKLGDLFSDHPDAAERADTSLKRLIGLQADDDVLAGNDIARTESIDSHDSAGVDF